MTDWKSYDFSSHIQTKIASRLQNSLNMSWNVLWLSFPPIQILSWPNLLLAEDLYSSVNWKPHFEKWSVRMGIAGWGVETLAGIVCCTFCPDGQFLVLWGSKPGWFVHFLAHFSNVKNKQARVPFHKPHNRGEICHCRRQCKLFATSVNLSINNIFSAVIITDIFDPLIFCVLCFYPNCWYLMHSCC